MRIAFYAVLSLVLLACGAEPPTPSTADEALAEVIEARRQVQELGLVQKTSRDYRRAEDHYRAALVQADAGDLRVARQRANRAVADYRRATLSALTEGPAREALSSFQAAAPRLLEARRLAAQREAAQLTSMLSAASGSHFDIQAFSETVLESAFELQGLVSGQVAIDPGPCQTVVQPQFFKVAVTGPTAGTVLTHAPIHYVAGGEVNLSLEIPVCTALSQIAVEDAGQSQVLATDASVRDPIEGTISNPFFYSILDRSSDGNRVTLDVRLHFPAYRDGRTLTFGLVLKSSTGSLLAETSVIVVAVSDVNGARTMSLSEHQLRNEFVVGTYQDFGDDGRKEDVQPDLIDPSYSALTLDIAPEGIHFASKVKADLPACDVTLSTQGLFHLEKLDTLVVVVWDVGPNVGATMSPLCEVAGLVLEPLRLVARIVVESQVKKQVKAHIQTEIDSLIARFAAMGTDPRTFIGGFETAEDEIVVTLNIPGDNVVLEVPYGRLRLDEAARLGMALNTNDQVLITASDLADVCIIDGSAPQSCDRKKSGPAGLFNWSTNTPVESPWPCTANGTCKYLEQRHNARKRLQGFRRDASKLPFPQQNVGALVGRLASAISMSRYQLMDTPCTVTASGGFDRLAFGANDYRYAGAAEFGSGARRITVIWPPIQLNGQGCITSTFSIPELMQEVGPGHEPAKR